MDYSPLHRALESPLPAESSRLFHGRGHCYEGLSFVNIDWFEPVVWAVLYGDVDDEQLLQLSESLLRLAESDERVKCVSLQRRVRGRATQDVIYGSLPGRTVALEAGACFELNFSANQNVGFFLDARPGREWLRARAEGKRVLNLFSYTCSFSIAALMGGADKVVNIDMAKSSLATGQRNHSLNGLGSGKVSFLPHDIFRSTRNLERLGPYDRVVIDPPSRQKGSFEADKDYVRLLRKLQPMLADGAEILACLNAPYLDGSFLPAVFESALPDFSLQQRLSQRSDFPESDLERCLKMQVFSVT